MSTCPQTVDFEVTGPPGTAIYTISFEGKIVQDNKSTWCYNVTVEGVPALSHWVLGVFELCPELLEEKLLSVTRNGVELEKEEEYVTGISDGVFGIKFDVGTEEGESPVQYCITLEGDYELTAVDVAVKGGPEPSQLKENALCGPSCIIIPDRTQKEVLTKLLESIALEETALAHIINAEGKKIQTIAQLLEDEEITPEETIELQKAIAKTLRMPIKKQMLLQFKLEEVLDFKEKLEIDNNNNEMDNDIN